jgi:hypothetical protein
MDLQPFLIGDLEGHQIISDVTHGTVESSEAIPGYLATAAIIEQGSGSGGAVMELAGGNSLVVASGPVSQSVADTLADIQARIADGQSTPVLASHLDALGLRAAIEAWARAS